MSFSLRAFSFRQRLITCVFPLVLLLFVTGCTVARPPASPTRDRAYIQYWPPSQSLRAAHAGDTAGSGRLRLAVKDLIDMKDVVTTAGSERFAKTRPPARRDAACLAGARRPGVVIVGKANTSELAVAPSGINEYFGTPINPLNRRLIPGGSSSGSAVAVANGSADVALGTDTAGSVRVPAACCGIVGLKTTHGLIPLDGVYPIAPRVLDTVGPLARDIRGVVTGMDLLRPGFARDYRAAASTTRPARKLRIGRLYLDGTRERIDRAVDRALAAAGFEVVPLGGRFREQWRQAESDTATIAAVGAWRNDRELSTRLGVTLRTKTIIALGGVQYTTAAHEAALARRPQWRAALRRVFREVDFIALPTLQRPPPRLPFWGGSVAFEAVMLRVQNTAPANLAGVPALAMPVPLRGPAKNRKVPVTSLQLVGPWRSEARLLQAGRVIEEALDRESPPQPQPHSHPAPTWAATGTAQGR